MANQLASVLIVACSLLLVQPALADELEQARATFTLGDEQLAAKRYSEARDSFESVLKVVEVPAVAFKAGQANEQLGKLLRAAELYTMATQLKQNRSWADKRMQLQAQRDADAALQALKGRIPTIKIEILGDLDAIAEVAIDDQPLVTAAFTTSQQLDPGSYRVRATTKDGRSLTEYITLAESDSKTVTLEISKAIPPASATTAPAPVSTMPATSAGSPTNSAVDTSTPDTGTRSKIPTRQWAGYASLGVGAAGLVLGTTAGLIAWSKYSDIKSQCGGTRDCPGTVYDQLNPTYETYKTWRTVSTVGFVVAGVGAATGVTLLLLRPKSSAVPYARVTAGPGSLALAGTF